MADTWCQGHEGRQDLGRQAEADDCFPGKGDGPSRSACHRLFFPPRINFFPSIHREANRRSGAARYPAWTFSRDNVTWRETAVIDECAIGPRRPGVLPHVDGLGRTVEVQEPIEQVPVRIGAQPWIEKRTYVLSGLLLAVAALDCVVGIPLAV